MTKTQKAYKIQCEWDIGLYDVYKSREAAMKDLKTIDWEGEFEDTLEALMEDGLVVIQEFKLK